MGFLEEVDSSQLPTIPEYYDGKTIFITGGTGFMGKVLIEKLLYSCSNLKRIYLLLRSKRGITPEERLKALYSSVCFTRLWNERPGAFESKVSLISGDITELGLAISEEDRTKLINETNIIFHVAASVKFDDPLKFAVTVNLRGTREVISLAKEVKNLESFIHVSTSYLNENRERIEEVIYPPYADWRDVINICENVNEESIRVLTPKFLGILPNTYVFAKQMAEHMVYEEKGKLPIVIIRPSVVVASVTEPVSGWLQSFNGPNGLCIGIGKGIIRVLYFKPECSLDYMPVDLAIRHFITASWLRGTKKLQPTDDIPIYHCCSGDLIKMSLKEVVEVGLKSHKRPLDNAIWSINCHATSSKIMYNFWFFLLQLLPALFIDTLLPMFGMKPMLWRLQRKIYTANMALEYFMTQHWNFETKNFLKCRASIKEEDRDQFHYDLESQDVTEYFEIAFYGGRKYLLHEKDEDLPKARAHNWRLYILDKVLKTSFIVYVSWKILNSDFVHSLFSCLYNYLFT